jgi:hypothetical protein
MHKFMRDRSPSSFHSAFPAGRRRKARRHTQLERSARSSHGPFESPLRRAMDHRSRGRRSLRVPARRGVHGLLAGRDALRRRARRAEAEAAGGAPIRAVNLGDHGSERRHLPPRPREPDRRARREPLTHLFGEFFERHGCRGCAKRLQSGPFHGSRRRGRSIGLLEVVRRASRKARRCQWTWSYHPHHATRHEPTDRGGWLSRGAPVKGASGGEPSTRAQDPGHGTTLGDFACSTTRAAP